MEYDEKVLGELATYLDKAKPDFEDGSKIDLCGTLYYIIVKLDKAGFDARWLIKPLITEYSKVIDEESKNRGIFNIVSLLEKYGCSQLQSSLWLSEIAELSQRRVLQIFQSERKIRSSVHDESNHYLEKLSEQIMYNSVLMYLNENQKTLPNNPHVKQAIQRAVTDLRDMSSDDPYIQTFIDLNIAELQRFDHLFKAA